MEANFVVFFSLFMILMNVRGSHRGEDNVVSTLCTWELQLHKMKAQAPIPFLPDNAVVHSYKHGFSGFAARLSDQEARAMARQRGVVSVFRDPILQLHTTHSWDFLQYQTTLELIDSNPGSDVASQSQGSDVIIGILDTGIWPEFESFSDKNIGPIPSRWKRTCTEGTDFNASNCNRKIIGARYYYNPDEQLQTYRTARDIQGHGTHVASTAAGAHVPNASYCGLAFGTARGGYPAARIAMYRVCTPVGCPGSAVLEAFDDAIADGVDVLSISLGLPAQDAPDFYENPISIGAFHSVQKGITVVCSAGNEGPSPSTIGNVAPWILTVAATAIDRDFETNVLLGNGKVIKGGGINFPNIQKSPVYRLIYGSSAPLFYTGFDVVQARKCNPCELAADKIRGKIVICEDDTVETQDRIDQVNNSGGVGIILINDQTRVLPSKFGTFPTTVISSTDAAEISQYVNSTRLVYELGPADYLQFLCDYGFNVSTIKLMSPILPGKFTCPEGSSTDMISNINYPSISIAKNISQAPVNVSRAVTNVGTDVETIYNVSVYTPNGLTVKAIPDTLQFTKNIKKLSYQVIFASSLPSVVAGDLFGTITWTNGKYKVRSPFVVSGG
ncbi:hypothetical protein Ancab_006976 [Ancistrocladus abbreviatus]